MLVIILTIILTGQKRFLIYPIFTVLLLLSNITKKNKEGKLRLVRGGMPSVVKGQDPLRFLPRYFYTILKSISYTGIINYQGADGC